MNIEKEIKAMTKKLEKMDIELFEESRNTPYKDLTPEYFSKENKKREIIHNIKSLMEYYIETINDKKIRTYSINWNRY